jgi:hypothetical protein
LQGDEASEVAGVGARGQFDHGIGSRGARPFHVDGRLGIVAIVARISTGAAGAGRRMDLRERAAWVSACKPQCCTEVAPVAGAVKVGVFNDYDRLPLSRITRREKRIQIVDGGQVRGYNQVTFIAGEIAAAGKGVRGSRLVHRARHEVVQRHDSGYDRRQRGRNARVAHVGDVLLTVHFEIVNLGMEGLQHLAGRPGKFDHYPAGIDQIDGKAVRLEPSRDRRQVLLRQAVALSKLLCGEPVMEIRRLGLRKSIDIFVECLFLLGRAPQLEPQMLHRKAIRDRAAVVGRRRFGTGIAPERDEIVLVDLIRDESGSHRRHARRGGGRRRKHRYGGQERQHAGEHDRHKSGKLWNLESGATIHIPPMD